MSKVLNFDALIIGSSFDALFKAYTLQSQGLNVAVVEQEETVGGLFRSVKTADASLEAHVNFIASTPTAQAMLTTIQKVVPELEFSALNLGPITLQNGQTQPFLGFGESSIQAMDEYAAFLSTDQLQLNMSLSELTVKIRALLDCQVLIQSEVTSLEVDPEAFVILNGTQRVNAKDIYYFDNPHKLSHFLTTGQHAISKTLVTRLSKLSLWTAIGLVFHHRQPVTESQAVHVLYGAKDQPSVGRFRQDAQGETTSYSSQWLTFVSQELAADSEQMGATIREMKKQIKRMYPNFLETVGRESIWISPDAYGHLPSGLISNGAIPKAPRLHVGSRYYSETPGVAGDLAALEGLLNGAAAPERAIEAQLT